MKKKIGTVSGELALSGCVYRQSTLTICITTLIIIIIIIITITVMITIIITTIIVITIIIAWVSYKITATINEDEPMMAAMNWHIS
jgi:hypothetical protein